MKQISSESNRFFVIIMIGLLAFGGNWFLSLLQGIPVPYVSVEFSFLLAGDTFAHGHVTNPTHPMWMHFETFHVLQQPTYMSKYPPGQGFFLAIGQVLLGHPIFGVWLSDALMCMAICWMLYGVVPARWALIGGLISVLQFGVFTYWSHSYWGGAVAALGGALVYGALPRIFKYQRLRDVCWLGLGIAVLANSRPLEGILIGIPVGCLVLPWKIRWEKVKSFNFVKKVGLPLVLLLLITIIGIGTYNKAITGKAELFPHRLYAQTQESFPMFLWDDLRPALVYHHPSISNFNSLVFNKYYSQKRTLQGFWADAKREIPRLFMFYFGYVLVIPVLFFMNRYLRRKLVMFKFILVVLILFVTQGVMACSAKCHYFSTLTGLAVFLVVQGLRSLVCLRSYKYSARFNLVIVLMVFQLLINISLIVPSRMVNFVSYGRVLNNQTFDPIHYYSRDEFKKELIQRGGKHLVLVSYQLKQFFFNEWVYNGSDIEHAQIIWARDMDEAHNAELLAYYKDRQVWHISVEKEPLKLRKYYDQR